MATISKSISINCPVGQVYDYLTEPKNLLEIWPSMVEVSNVSRQPNGAHEFDWVYKMAGLRFKGHSRPIEVEPQKRVVMKNEKGIPSTFHWKYEGQNGVTKVTVDIEYTLPGKLLGKLATPLVEKSNEREAQTLLRNLKTRMETGKVPVQRKKVGLQPSAAQR